MLNTHSRFHFFTASLSRLVESIEQSKEREMVIARNGRPVAKLVPIDVTSANNRIGIAKGLFEVPDDIDTYNLMLRSP